METITIPETFTITETKTGKQAATQTAILILRRNIHEIEGEDSLPLPLNETFTNVIVATVATVVTGNNTVVKEFVKGLGRVKVEAPRVIEPGREYEITCQVFVDRKGLERFLWILRQICRLLCTLPWTKPYMPSLLCKMCGAEKLYLGAHGG